MFFSTNLEIGQGNKLQPSTPTQEVFLSHNHICIAMEYANGGNLGSYIQNAGGRLKEAAARWFFQQLILGIDYCHRMGVVNRDIKLENTLLQVDGPWLI